MDVLTRIAALLIAILLAIDAFSGERHETLRVDGRARTSRQHRDDVYRVHFAGGRVDSCAVGRPVFEALRDGDVVSVDTSRVFKACDGIRRGDEVFAKAELRRWLMLVPMLFLLAAAFGWIQFEGREDEPRGERGWWFGWQAAMGYDFMLFRLRHAPASFPADFPPDFDVDALVPFTDAAPLHDAVRMSALFKPGSLIFDGARFDWRTPDGGSLGVNTTATSIDLDVHAHWNHVADLFELVRSVWPDVALFDMQSVHLHDPASFRAFVASSYRDKADALARRGAAG